MNDQRTIPVILYGEARKRFGKRFDLAVSTPAEAIRALMTTRPGFRAYLQERSDAPFRILRGEEALDEKGLLDPVGRTEVIKIIPVVKGAKDGFGQILMGAALLAAVYFTGGMAGAAFSLVGTSGLSTFVIGMGMSMVLGGIAQMLAPTPQSTGSGISGNNDLETWTFGSPTVTTGQGGCVPLLFGKHRIGGHLISAGIDAQTWQPGGFDPAVCLTDDGVRYGNGDTVPWMWAIAP